MSTELSSILITPLNSEEIIIIKEFFKSKKIKTKILSVEEKEDLGLLHFMKLADRTKTVSRNSVMKILNRKDGN